MVTWIPYKTACVSIIDVSIIKFNLLCYIGPNKQLANQSRHPRIPLKGKFCFCYIPLFVAL